MKAIIKVELVKTVELGLEVSSDKIQEHINAMSDDPIGMYQTKTTVELEQSNQEQDLKLVNFLSDAVVAQILQKYKFTKI